MGKDYDDLLVKLIPKYGFTESRNGKGSHKIWYNPETNRSITISKGMSRNLANSVLRKAGIDFRFP